MSMTLNKIKEAYPETEFLTAPGFDDAVIGVDMDSARLIYSASKCIDLLVYKDNMVFEDAVEYFEEKVRPAFDDFENGPIWANTEF